MISVEEFPDEETEEAMGLDSPFDILGLYRGVALPHKSVSDPRPNVDMIFLYRRPILDYWCETGEDLDRLVRHVLIHEIGHHFGFSDEDMERIEALRTEDRGDPRAQLGQRLALKPRIGAQPQHGAPARMRQREGRRQELAPAFDCSRHRHCST